MKKLKLDLDQLAVDTFAPVADTAGKRGTVRGHNSMDPTTCTEQQGSCAHETCGGPSCITCPGIYGCSFLNCVE